MPWHVVVYHASPSWTVRLGDDISRRGPRTRARAPYLNPFPKTTYSHFPSCITFMPRPGTCLSVLMMQSPPVHILFSASIPKLCYGHAHPVIQNHSQTCIAFRPNPVQCYTLHTCVGGKQDTGSPYSSRVDSHPGVTPILKTALRGK